MSQAEAIKHLIVLTADQKALKAVQEKATELKEPLILQWFENKRLDAEIRAKAAEIAAAKIKTNTH